MPKTAYIPRDDEGKAKLLLHFRDTIGAHLPALGLDPNDPDLLTQAADAARFRALVDFAATMRHAATSWTAGKDYERDGGATAPSGVVVPVLPPNFPAPVEPGILGRFRSLVKRLRPMKTYTETIGKALGIEGSDETPANLAAAQPAFELDISGNAVQVRWSWQGLRDYVDLIEIQVDRADGKGFVLLTYDTTPGYTDTHPFPATPAKWTYRAIFRAEDKQIGKWSNPVTITVG